MRPLKKKMERKIQPDAVIFQNLLLDCKTYRALFIWVSNEMVNTRNHTATMLIFSVFCSPVISDS